MNETLDSEQWRHVFTDKGQGTVMGVWSIRLDGISMRTIWGEGYGGEATRWNDLSCGCIKSWIDREISMPKCHYPSTGLPLYQPHKHTNDGKLLTKPDGL